MEIDEPNLILEEQAVEGAQEARPLVKWKELELSGQSPRPRHGHRSVAIKDQIVVYGGGNDGIINELHVFNTLTKQWSQPQVRGNDIPPGCASYGACVDGTRLLIFGGMLEFGRYSNELYELQATKWEWRHLHPRPSSDGEFPKPRLAHTLNIASDKKMYLFGGLCNMSPEPMKNLPVYLNDLFVMDVTRPVDQLQWEAPKVHGEPPSPRESHTANIVEANGKKTLIVYGGMNGVRLGDVWFLDLVSLTWTCPVISGIPPEPRSLHTASLIGDCLYVYGGWVPMGGADAEDQKTTKEWKCSSTLACLDTKNLKWQPLSLASFSERSIPVARAGHSAATVNSRIYIWSGRDGYRKAWNNQICCKDLWFLETASPSLTSRVHLIRASINALELSWNPISCSDAYLLQVAKVDTKSDVAVRNAPLGTNVVKMVRTPGQPHMVRMVKTSGVVGKPPGKILMKSDEDQGLSDPVQLSQHQISTQGTTYKAPVSTPQQSVDESGLPQNLFDESLLDEGGSSAASPPPPPAPPAQPEEEKPKIEEPAEGPQPVPQVAEATPAEPKMEEEKSKTDEEDSQEEDGEKQEEQKKEAIEWFDVGLFKEAQASVSQYFLKGQMSILEHCGGDVDVTMNASKVNFMQKADLESGTTYRFRVAGVNSLGVGPFGEVVQFKTCLPGYPGAPSSIRITKSPDGAQLTWEPPSSATNSGTITEYSVYLAVRNQNLEGNQLAFMRVYCGTANDCIVNQSSLQGAFVDTANKPAIIFRIAAKNEKGYGPATQVRWLQDQKPLPQQLQQPQAARFPVNTTHNNFFPPLKRSRINEM